MVGSLRYEIASKVANGDTAETFLVRAADRREPAVLKLFKRRERSGAVVEGFLGQLSAFQNVHHPALVEHLESGRSTDGRPYLVMERLEGEDLARHLRRSGPLAPSDLIRLLLPICELLESLGQRGLFYPELRASDLFFSGGLPRFEPKLLDAGRAWLGDCGVFRAPECSPGESGDLRSDVFALGVLMYEALEGRPPFIDDDGDPWQRRMDSSLSSFRGSSVALTGIVERCLSRDPRDRFASPAELARSIAAGGAPISTGAEPRAEPDLPDDEGHAEKVGDLLGSYRLEKLLGEGSMGRVFLARHLLLGRMAAIKVMRPEYARSPQFIDRFFQEADAVNRINHQHIVEVFDFVKEPTERGERVYCVMEMLGGVSLTELLQRERLSIHRVLNIARQISLGLDAAHRLGVVHRDIKPDNIFIECKEAPDFVKILDFGVAKVLSPTASTSPARTREGVIVGTPRYMAPEQAVGFAADPRSDIYSVGAVCYQMLAGHLPFEAATLGQLMAKVIAQPPTPLGAQTPLGEKIPSELASLVMSCLEKDPRRRPETMVKLGECLAAIQGGGPKPVRRRGWKSVGLSAGAAVATVFALAAFLRLPGRSAAETPVTRAEPPSTESPRPQARKAPPAETQWVNVRIASSPSGARVIRRDSGAELGLTPLSRPFSPTERDVVLRLELPGHNPIEQTIHPAERPSVEVSMSRLKRAVKKRPTLQGFGERIGDDGLINPFEE
ncbi:MAG TPA: protein kinase [Myxococcaceae bacterium]|nr:protein kinase [Myxococcaceae bacterium]